MTRIRVLLADDHTLVRAGIRSLLENITGVEVVGEAGEGREVLRLAEALRPDLVVLDVGMPGLNGLEVAGHLASLDASIRVLILSMHSSEEYVLRALRTGCAGYLLKGSAVSELEIAVHAAVGEEEDEGRILRGGGADVLPHLRDDLLLLVLDADSAHVDLAGLQPARRLLVGRKLDLFVGALVIDECRTGPAEPHRHNTGKHHVVGRDRLDLDHAAIARDHRIGQHRRAGR